MTTDHFIRRAARWLAVASVAVLAACSNGSNIPTDSPPTEGVPTGSAPVITEQPQGATVDAGSSATFTVQASGSPSPSYQWQRNGVDIAGATSASYTTSALALADGGASYSVVVRNTHGAATSDDAGLGVRPLTTADKQKLIEALLLTWQFFDAASAPLAVIEHEDDGTLVFGDPANVCFSGSLASTWDGAALPVGQVVPASGTLVGSFDACDAGTALITGSGSYLVSLASMNPLAASLTVDLASMSRKVVTGGTVEDDVTVAGSGVATIAGTVAPFMMDIGVTVNDGSTLVDHVRDLSALFHGGTAAVRTEDTGCGGYSVRLGFDDLQVTVSGVRYGADGFLQFDRSGSGVVTTAGDITFTSEGIVVARIRQDASGQMVIEVDGVDIPTQGPTITRAVRRENALGVAGSGTVCAG